MRFSNLTLAALLSAALLAACGGNLPEPAPLTTPTVPASGPTLAASATVLPLMPEEMRPSYFGGGQNNLTAAALPSGGELPPVAVGTPQAAGNQQPVQITTGSGIVVSGSLYQVGTERRPGLLLLGDAGDNWGTFPSVLLANGFTVLAMELSGSYNLNDFSMLMQALSNTGTVDPASMGAIGFSAAADIVLQGCALDALCDVAVLLSPLQATAAAQSLGQYNPRPLYLAYAEQDAVSAAVAQTVQPLAQGDLQLQQVPGSSDRGTGLLLVPEIQNGIISFLTQQFSG